MIAALRRYSLITVAGDALSVHRLVQAVLRGRLAHKPRLRWAVAAVEIVSAAFPYKVDDPGTWAPCGVLLPHALAAAEHAEGMQLLGTTTSGLLNETGL